MPYPFELPPLPYEFNALEPAIDARTMEIHHDRHHGAYVTNLNNALKDHPDFQREDIEVILANLNQLPESIRTAVRNNGGGHANHSMFWQILRPGGRNNPSGGLERELASTFGSFDAFKEKFSQAATTRFGSGWAWLALDPQMKLQVYSTANQDSPLMEGHLPILGLDVWEHAYYLQYQWRRADYIKAFWSIVNWNVVEEYYQAKRAEPS